MSKRHRCVSGVVFTFVMIVTAAVAAAPAPAPIQSAEKAGDEIVLGMSTALSGPAADLGLNMRAGVLAALEEANRAGGIHGRRLQLLSLDDSYEPAKTVPNM